MEGGREIPEEFELACSAGPFDAGARASALMALLSSHPSTSLGALGGVGVVLPWPASIPVLPGHVVDDRTVLDLVVPEDQMAVVRAFQQAGESGVGEAPVRLLKDPGRWVTLHYFDLREDHGVMVRVLVPEGVAGCAPPPSERPGGSSPRYGVLKENSSGVIVDCDEAFAQMWGGETSELIGGQGLDGVHPEDHGIAIETWVALLDSGQTRRAQWRSVRKDGSVWWTEVTLHLHQEHGRPELITLECMDVTNEVTAQHGLRSQELRLSRITEAVPVGLFEVDPDHHVVYANDRAYALLGTEPTAELDELLDAVVPEHRLRLHEALKSTLAGDVDTSVDVEVELHLPGSGEPRRYEMSVRSLTDAMDRVVGAIVCVSDVTESARARVKLERDIIEHAFHDPLTGLANRTLLLNRIEDAVTRTNASGDLVAIVLADLDGFKAINDSFGHSVGDELLRRVSDRVRAMLRLGDTAAHVGGDEFVILMEGFIDPDLPRHIAEQLLVALSQSFEIDDRTIEISASIGIATSATAHGTEELLRDADLAMYRAKDAGKGRYETFAPEMHEAVLARVDLEQSLRRGLEDGDLVVFYQPIHDLTSGRVTSAEALVRWRHPTRGMISPGDFIPLAEDTGLIVPIGQWVLEQACTEAVRWNELMGATAPNVSVNLSARQLRSPTLVDGVRRAITNSSIDPRALTLEITETVLIENVEANTTVLDQLQRLGIELAIDDFGTGYSSLAYLQHLPVDVLKIDKAFVERVSEGGRYIALVDGILGLARNLSLRAVAEGIETIAQLKALQALRCAAGQGFLFSRPIESSAFHDYLVASRRGPWTNQPPSVGSRTDIARTSSTPQPSTGPASILASP